MSTKGLAVVSGSTPIHKLLSNGYVTFSGSVNVTGSIMPDLDDVRDIGSSTKRWSEIHSYVVSTGAIFEYGLETKGIGNFETGTVLCWHNGRLVPSERALDPLVMGVSYIGKDQPIILGAEFILVTGEVREGDFLVTSNKLGHAMSSRYASVLDESLLGKVIGQALEYSQGDSKLIKCYISKR